MTTLIQAPVDAVYLADFLTELPVGIVNKKGCGVGGSYIAITSEQNYIIAVPTIELIKNKQYQHSNIIGVYGNYKFSTFKTELSDKLQLNAVIKIMVTYDSLPKVLNWLIQLNQDPYNNYRLLVDEYHKILSDYAFRDIAIDNLLKESLKFSYCTYLSATPIEPRFTPKLLQQLPYTEIVWTATRKVTLDREKTTKPYASVVNIIRKYKASNYKLKMYGYVSSEAYFFVNSVKGIAEIIRKANLKPDEVKIICADNDRNQDILNNINPEYEFEISNVHKPNKPFTFVTSKSFLGVDFYSDSGIIYVVSNVNRKTTLLDISTDLYQIAGRIRNLNNPFKNRICHIYNTGAYEMSPEEFKELVATKIEATNEKIEVFNNLMNDKQRKALLKCFETKFEDYYSYYNVETGLLEFNELQQLNEEFNYYIVNDIYTNGLTLRDAYIKAGFDITSTQNYNSFVEEDNNTLSTLTKQSFKDVIKEYVDCIDNNEIERANELEQLEPEIKELVSKLGTSRIRGLSYNKSKILEEAYNNCDEVVDVIEEEVKTKYVSGNFYSSKQVKQDLQKLYKMFDITKKAKATDVTEYINIKNTIKSINGKKVAGFVVE
jgi:hypothetical protein